MSEKQNPMGQIIAKALQDEPFKQQLMADPAALFKAAGFEIPEGITLKVVADTESERHIVLPAISSSELSDEDLAEIVGSAEKTNKNSCKKYHEWRDCDNSCRVYSC